MNLQRYVRDLNASFTMLKKRSPQQCGSGGAVLRVLRTFGVSEAESLSLVWFSCCFGHGRDCSSSQSSTEDSLGAFQRCAAWHLALTVTLLNGDAGPKHL